MRRSGNTRNADSGRSSADVPCPASSTGGPACRYGGGSHFSVWITRRQELVPTDSESCSLRPLTEPSVRFTIDVVTWAEVIRKLRAAGFIEVRSGKGSHLLLKHPTSGKEVWVAVHTKKDAGRLGNRILREAGVE